MPSKVPALIDYLVATFTAAPAFAPLPGQTTPQVTVFDGPATTALDPGLKLWVGLTDPDNPAAEAAAVMTQTRDDLGSSTRGEVSEIRCCAEAWSGMDTIAAVRVAAFGILAAVEALVRADQTRFGGNAALAAPGVTAGELLQDNNTDTGAVARIPFSIAFKSFT